MNAPLDENGARNFLNQIFKLWIEPEIARRRVSGKASEDFAVARCLIKLPPDRAPMVEFNNEVEWLANAKIPLGTIKAKGQPIFLHEVQEITGVSPPKVDGRRVAFVYLFQEGAQYSIVFDFSPNVPENLLSKEKKEAWRFSKAIADSLQAVLIEKVVRYGFVKLVRHRKACQDTRHVQSSGNLWVHV